MASTALLDGLIDDNGRNRRNRSGSVSTTATTASNLTVPGTVTSSGGPITPGVSISGYFIDEPVSLPDTPNSSTSQTRPKQNSEMSSRNASYSPRDGSGSSGLRAKPSRSELLLQAMPEDREGESGVKLSPRPREDDERTMNANSRSGTGGSRSRSGSVIVIPPGPNGSGGRGAATSNPTPTQSQMDRLAVHRMQSQQIQQQQQQSSGTRPRGGSSARAPTNTMIPPGARIRNTPRLPNHVADPAPSTAMYWSRAPVFGHLPDRAMRGHSLTPIDNIVWQIGGCDANGACFKDILTFNTDTMQWSHPETTGDPPPPCRAHSATAVDKRIFVFGGGSGVSYFNHLFVLDTVSRHWTHIKYPSVSDDKLPIPRRAHTTWVYQGKIYMFGGGNGAKALNDIWTLDITVPYEDMKWEEVTVRGRLPGARGYHTANLVRDVVVVVGGSDGMLVFDDVWVLHLTTMTWQEIKLEVNKKRLGHTSTQVGSYLFIIGGHDGTQYNRDVQLFNLVTCQWEPRETRGRPPSIRGYHRAVLYDSRIFVIGGFDGQHVFDDVYILDLAAAAYLPQVTNFGLMQEAEVK